MYIRIRFPTEQERIKGNYVLLTNTVSRRLRGDIFEIDERDRKLLDDRQIPYEVLALPESNGFDPADRVPPPFEAKRRDAD